VLTVGKELYEAPELLFNPSLGGFPDVLGATALASSSLSKVDIDARKELLNNVVLTGGSTMFTGFEKRVESDLQTSNRSRAGVLRDVCVHVVRWCFPKKTQKNLRFIDCQSYCSART
jgi:hypothetical protein